jgi:hypothetical protein
MKLSNFSKNILCVLEQNPIIRIKKDSKKFELIKKEFEFICQNNKNIKCYCSVDNSELFIVVDPNYSVRSFIL